jgi:multidrug efflux pump subunit AcrA (membrane-fusion protein)
VAAAVDIAKRDVAASFKAREATLAGEKDAAIAAAIAKARAEKDAEFQAAKAALAVAATAATAAAVAAAKAAEAEKGVTAVAEARTQEAAKTRATDLEASQAACVPGSCGGGEMDLCILEPNQNAALRGLLEKLDGRMSDICTLVYFVSYFLNKMIRPSLAGVRGNNTRICRAFLFLM